MINYNTLLPKGYEFVSLVKSNDKEIKWYATITFKTTQGKRRKLLIPKKLNPKPEHALKYAIYYAHRHARKRNELS